ncbi:protein LURP-one-related 15 [Tanacetum coccineum]
MASNYAIRQHKLLVLNDALFFAKMHKKHTLQNNALGKETFDVTVYPNVDYAFIVALVVILHEINEEKNDVE